MPSLREKEMLLLSHPASTEQTSRGSITLLQERKRDTDGTEPT